MPTPTFVRSQTILNSDAVTSITIDCTGGDFLLIKAARGGASGEAWGTFSIGGVALTSILSVTASNSHRYAGYKVAPGSGNVTVDISAATANGRRVVAEVWSGVDPTTPVVTSNSTNSPSGTVFSASLAAANGDVASVLYHRHGAGAVVSLSPTATLNLDFGDQFSASRTVSGYRTIAADPEVQTADATAGGTSQTGFMAIAINGATASAPTVSSVSPTTVTNGQTNVVITGTGFGATQGAGQVRLGTSSSNPATGAVAQTVTAWSDTSITITVVKGALAFDTPVYLYVTNNGGQSNAAGYSVTITPRVYVRERMIDLGGTAVANQTGIVAALFHDIPTLAAPAPTQLLTGLTTDASGNTNWQINRGALAIGAPVWVVAFKDGTPARGTCKKVTPVYE